MKTARLFGLVAVLAACTGGDRNSWKERLEAEDLSPREFGRIATAALRDRFPKATVVSKDDLTLEVTLKDGSSVRAYLDNLWTEVYEEAPAARAARVERWLATVEQGFEQAEASDSPGRSDNIVPLVRGQGYLDELKQVGGGESDVAAQPLAGDLWIVYARDLENGIAILPKEDRDALGLSDADLFKLALDNLNRILPDVEMSGNGPVYLLTCGGDYESSLLLFDELWQPLAGHVKGDLVAGAPNRDICVFTGTEEPGGVAALRAAVAKSFDEGGRPVSRRLYRRTDSGWAVLER